MSYQERRTVVSLITGIAIIAAYCIYAFGRYQAGLVAEGDLRFWAGAILTFIGIGIVAVIIIQIVFHVLMSIAMGVKMGVQMKIRDEQVDDRQIEKSIQMEFVEDEMDRLIEMKSLWVGFAIAGIGFIAGLVALLLGSSAAVMLNIFFLSIAGGTVLEGVAQLYYYRRGLANG
ncbi:MAG TPA: hypothetical protein VMT46_17660 [Anaerolineaceae bacterium]|nr:hypothetical protein [Anaerolineaceae bacterium]